MIAGQSPMFSAMLADHVAEIQTLTAGPDVVSSDGVRTRVMHYELNPMVWKPIEDLLQIACPGLIRYTDTVYFSTELPGWQFTTEWAGVPGISHNAIQIEGHGRCEDDGPMGCRVLYEMRVRCTLPLVGGMIERTITDGFERTCRQVPGVMQTYFSSWG